MLSSTSAVPPGGSIMAGATAPLAGVLDCGWGGGTPLSYLWHFKRVVGRGIELSMDGVQAAVAQGLSVIQGDADTDLMD